MTTLEKLQKADKTNIVTKKDGLLKQRTIEAINDYRNRDGKFYTTYTSGRGRFTSNLTNDSIYWVIKLLGYKFQEGNDSPRGGKTGDFIKVSKRAFNNIISLIK